MSDTYLFFDSKVSQGISLNCDFRGVQEAYYLYATAQEYIRSFLSTLMQIGELAYECQDNSISTIYRSIQNQKFEELRAHLSQMIDGQMASLKVQACFHEQPIFVGTMPLLQVEEGRISTDICKLGCNLTTFYSLDGFDIFECGGNSGARKVYYLWERKNNWIELEPASREYLSSYVGCFVELLELNQWRVHSKVLESKDQGLLLDREIDLKRGQKVRLYKPKTNLNINSVQSISRCPIWTLPAKGSLHNWEEFEYEIVTAEEERWRKSCKLPYHKHYAQTFEESVVRRLSNLFDRQCNLEDSDRARCVACVLEKCYERLQGVNERIQKMQNEILSHYLQLTQNSRFETKEHVDRILDLISRKASWLEEQSIFQKT